MSWVREGSYGQFYPSMGKSKSEVHRAFKFGTKWVPIEVNNWTFCLSNSRQNIQFWISQKWLKVSTLNSHPFLTLKGTHFALDFKAFGVSDWDFLSKTYKVWGIRNDTHLKVGH